MSAQAPSLSRGHPILAYIKPSDYCNVGCDHCYLPKEVRAQKVRMTDETFERALDTIEKMAASQRAPGIMIVWHGGEPLALPQSYFDAMCERLSERLPDAIQTIQTSLIPYRKEWSATIHRWFGGSIGSSVDFSQRTLKGSSSAYLDLWMSKVSLARSHGHHIIPGMVPSKGELGRAAEIFHWLAERQFTTWNIDRYNSYGHADPSRPSNKEHSTFLTDIFDLAMSHFAKTGSAISINTVRAALGGVLFNNPGDRWGGTCSNQFIVVNPDGSTNACPDKISYETFSNVRDGYDGFKISETRKKWIRDHLLGHRNSDCPTCPFNSFCKSGCPLTPNTPETEGECSGYHRHLRHVRDWADSNRHQALAYLKACEDPA